MKLALKTEKNCPEVIPESYFAQLLAAKKEYQGKTVKQVKDILKHRRVEGTVWNWKQIEYFPLYGLIWYRVDSLVMAGILRLSPQNHLEALEEQTSDQPLQK